MNRLQAIEDALSSINQAAFQELCDGFLLLKYRKYSVFSRNGSQSGKQKTVKGTPDTILLLPNGKYIFVEYSTNKTAGVKKLANDVRKCIDFSKTNIPVNEIAEIILCVNFKLKPAEIATLKSILADTGIELKVYTLDSLAIEIKLNHRNLAYEYLKLPLDTGQIVSKEIFIEEYNRASKGISTPLDNTFLHREQELKELKEAIEQKDFIILTGAPGVGKTKLALEGINNFLSENLNFDAYCVSYKNCTLLDDLYQYFDSDSDYILFVDDANRIDAFSQITGFYKGIRKGKLKILITVRDYAFREIGTLCQEFSPIKIELVKFSDEQIIDIISTQPFEILNQGYHKEIVRISDGNPRLAIMTTLLAKEHQNINVLRDVSELFENYFSTFIKDKGDFANEINIKCLGLIAFFNAIPYKDREITISILNNFGIEFDNFIDAIDKLDKLELVEIQFDHVKIPEQNLATYFFYKAFIKDNLLSFEILLNKYFDSNSNRFEDCVIPANNTFGVEKVMNKLQPFLQNHWKVIKTEEEKAFQYLFTFWYYLKLESLEFIFNILKALPSVMPLKYKVTNGNNAFSYSKINVIELLGKFLRNVHNLKDVIELGFEYTRKKPEHLPEWIREINEQLKFDTEDQYQYRFERQIILYKILIDGLNKGDILLTIAFYELSKTFLSFYFHHDEGGRNGTYIFYDYHIPNTTTIQNFRQNIWNAVECNYNKNLDDSFSILISYSRVDTHRTIDLLDITKKLIEFEIPFLINIIEKHLTYTSFEHCRYVQDQIKLYKRISVSHPAFSTLGQKFTNSTYEMFLKLDWNRYGDKERHEFRDFREYDKLKEAEIRTSFIFKNEAEIKEFYKTFAYIIRVSDNAGSIRSGLDLIIDENCTNNFERGCVFLREVINKKNEVEYVPRIVFSNLLKTKEQSKRIWDIIQQKEFLYKELWELSFYENIDESLLTMEDVEALVHTVSCMKDLNILYIDRLQKFLTLEPNLFQIILITIVDRNKKDGTQIRVWFNLFDTHFDKLGDDIELIKKAYINQDKVDDFFDLERKGFLNILKRDSRFLVELVKNLYAEKGFGSLQERNNLVFVWQVDNIEEILKEVFELAIEKDRYFSLSTHFCNSFFKNLQGDAEEKAKKFLLDYCRANFSDSDKMNVIVYIARHSMRELFEEILLLFLSLCTDTELFSKIWWRGNSTSGSGNDIFADIEMADWYNIQSIVEKSTVGTHLIPIRQYLTDRIEDCKRSGDCERQRRFLKRN